MFGDSQAVTGVGIPSYDIGDGLWFISGVFPVWLVLFVEFRFNSGLLSFYPVSYFSSVSDSYYFLR